MFVLREGCSSTQALTLQPGLHQGPPQTQKNGQRPALSHRAPRAAALSVLDGKGLCTVLFFFLQAPNHAKNGGRRARCCRAGRKHCATSLRCPPLVRLPAARHGVHSRRGGPAKRYQAARSCHVLSRSIFPGPCGGGVAAPPSGLTPSSCGVRAERRKSVRTEYLPRGRGKFPNNLQG